MNEPLTDDEIAWLKERAENIKKFARPDPDNHLHLRFLATIADLRAEREKAIGLMSAHMTEHDGLEDYVRNLLQAYLSEKDNAETAEKQIPDLRAERDQLKTQLAKRQSE